MCHYQSQLGSNPNNRLRSILSIDHISTWLINCKLVCVLERTLREDDRPLEILQEWGCHRDEVRFVLRYTVVSPSAQRQQQHRRGTHAIVHRSRRRGGKFRANDHSIIINVTVTALIFCYFGTRIKCFCRLLKYTVSFFSFFIIYCNMK